MPAEAENLTNINLQKVLKWQQAHRDSYRGKISGLTSSKSHSPDLLHQLITKPYIVTL